MNVDRGSVLCGRWASLLVVAAFIVAPLSDSPNKWLRLLPTVLKFMSVPFAILCLIWATDSKLKNRAEKPN